MSMKSEVRGKPGPEEVPEKHDIKQQLGEVLDEIEDFNREMDHYFGNGKKYRPVGQTNWNRR